MKKLNSYIIEKFKISKDIKIKPGIDNMNDDDILIYSDELDDEGERQDDEDYLKKVNDKINQKYYGFVGFREEITDNKDIDDNILIVRRDFCDVYDKVFRVVHSSCEIKISNGRYCISVINSGTRKTNYYIYALTKKGYEEVHDFYANEANDKNVLFDLDNFEEIKDVTII